MTKKLKITPGAVTGVVNRLERRVLVKTFESDALEIERVFTKYEKFLKMRSLNIDFNLPAHWGKCGE